MEKSTGIRIHILFKLKTHKVYDLNEPYTAPEECDKSLELIDGIFSNLIFCHPLL